MVSSSLGPKLAPSIRAYDWLRLHAAMVDSHQDVGRTRYFLITSRSEDNIRRAMRFGLWATQRRNELILDAAYQQCESVILIFTCKRVQAFFGWARMVSPIGDPIDRYAYDPYQQYGRSFSVDWCVMKRMDYRHVGNLQGVVYAARDGWELPAFCGRRLIRLFADVPDEFLNLPSPQQMPAGTSDRDMMTPAMPASLAETIPIHTQGIRYFIMTSKDQENIHVSMRTGVWATQRKNEANIQAAFEDAAQVILIFGSRYDKAYLGYAKMSSRLGDDSIEDIFTLYGRNFRVQWLNFSYCEYRNVDYLLGGNGRDGLEVSQACAHRLCCILDKCSLRETTPLCTMELL